jgi:hypothetical protein
MWDFRLRIAPVRLSLLGWRAGLSARDGKLGFGISDKGVGMRDMR